MAGPYYIYSGASGSGTGADWTNAFTNWKAMLDYGGTGLGPGTSGNKLAAGDIIYVAYDHDDSGATYGANTTIYAQTTAVSAPVKVISCTRDATPLYQTGSTYQIDFSGDNYNIIFDGYWSFDGFKFRTYGSSKYVAFASGKAALTNCTVRLGNTGQFYPNCEVVAYNLTLDLQDSTSDSGEVIALGNYSSYLECYGLTLSSPSGRTADLIQTTGYLSGTQGVFSGCDFSNWTGSSLISRSRGSLQFNNCILASDTPAFTGTATHRGRYEFINCSASNKPYLTYIDDPTGVLSTDTGITRTGGATVEEQAISWKIVSTSGCYERKSFSTPWIYGVLSSTGSKTFTVCIAGSASLYDDEIWLAVEYLGTSGEAKYTMASGARANITATRAQHTTDGSSSWTGSPGSALQLLEVTATVNVAGLYRARVVVGKASTTVYIDPKVTVS